MGTRNKPRPQAHRQNLRADFYATSSYPSRLQTNQIAVRSEGVEQIGIDCRCRPCRGIGGLLFWVANISNADIPDLFPVGSAQLPHGLIFQAFVAKEIN